MNNIIRINPLISIVWLIVLLSTPVNLNASSPTPPGTSIQAPTSSEHKQAIDQFVTEINQIQNQVLDISQLALNNPILFEEKFKSNTNYLNNSIEKLNKSISDYLKLVPKTGPQNVHVLLVLNSLNFVKNELYWLDALTYAKENVVRIPLLNEYFRSRIAATDTLNTLENLLLQYNP